MISIDHHSPTRSRLRAIGHGMAARFLCFIQTTYSSNYHYASNYTVTKVAPLCSMARYPQE